MEANLYEDDPKLILDALINSLTYAKKAAELQQTPIVLLTIGETEEAIKHLEYLSKLLYS